MTTPWYRTPARAHACSRHRLHHCQLSLLEKTGANVTRPCDQAASATAAVISRSTAGASAPYYSAPVDPWRCVCARACFAPAMLGTRSGWVWCAPAPILCECLFKLVTAARPAASYQTQTWRRGPRALRPGPHLPPVPTREAPSASRRRPKEAVSCRAAPTSAGCRPPSARRRCADRGG